MNTAFFYIGGAGIVSSLGAGLAATEQMLRENRSAIRPLTAFALLQGTPLPVGQVDGLDDAGGDPSLPRTHRLARLAAREAMAGTVAPPDAIVIGTTTGGIAVTEQLLRDGEQNKQHYRYHGLGTVARVLAEEFNCTGPALTVSTACSSGVVAIAVAMAMLRCGTAKTVLVGGVDSLCRLTYFGFHSLQLVDRNICKPLDRNRAGMAVAEGAGMLLLTTVKPATPLAELGGVGLSCDAYHPAAPHPEGQGAFAAMSAALAHAGSKPEDIGYINLHGTGTPDNDLAESKAVRRLFAVVPPLSSIKGATGHSLAAAGAIEAVVSMLAVSRRLLPANTGLVQVDPALGVTPLATPAERQVKAVLSNSFGFGGNNGSLVVGAPDVFSAKASPQSVAALAIHGYSCLTGAGDILATMDRLKAGGFAAGPVGQEPISASLPAQSIRRLKRLPRLTLSLAKMAQKDAPGDFQPHAVFMGTGWGALSETHDFLARLATTQEQFPSPTDFVGSVHNGPASQVAIMFGATGPNITASDGDYSFEQALLAASLMMGDSPEPAFVLGADEGHETFSPLLDGSIAPGSPLADGGGALVVSRQADGAKCFIAIPFYGRGMGGAVANLIAALGADWQSRCGLVMAGIPAAYEREGKAQLAEFVKLTGLMIPLVRYRRLTGEFASASAVATALAASVLDEGVIPGALAEGSDIVLDARRNKILILGFGQNITAMELSR